MVASQIHLVRHGEVFNPQRVLYGRLPNFGLSDLGHEMARAAAAQLVERRRAVSALYASPLQRTQESAQPVSEAFELPIVTDPRIIEPTNRFEGMSMRGRQSALKNPRTWPWLRNPTVPSWGEPYASIRTRMLAAMNDAYNSVDSGDVVLVSHQLPIWTTHLAIAGRPLFHDPRKRRCELSSVTSFERVGNRFVEVGYVDPAAHLAENATDVGAV
ncbi:histidine phosphatase family protein [Agreia sp. COWG]|uniref:histidine phosphatase family protein n=1 Tax=Agreia sp. COWG TaxID=2773266 RepID=UPI001926C3AC|nr:histidine phosphatase family protein [Agreia sp. COWG]